MKVLHINYYYIEVVEYHYIYVVGIKQIQIMDFQLSDTQKSKNNDNASKVIDNI